jgi:hypothetical protein
MTKISEQRVKIVDTDSTVISLNIKQLGAVGVMPVQLTDSAGVAIDTLPISGTFSLGAGVLTIGKVGLVDLSGDEINWADVANDAIRVNVVAGGAGDGSILDGVNSAIKATVLDYANSNPLAVRLTDAAGDYVAAGGGTQYAEDSVHISGDTLTLAGVVQQAADAALSGDGDRSLLQVDATGYLKVNVKAGSAAGVQYTEGDVDATITGTAIMWEDAGNVLASVSAAKPLPIGDAGGTITVDGTFWQATQPISAVALPLPAGASTSALQGGGLPAALGAGGGLKVDGSGTALPVTGTITAVTSITNAVAVTGTFWQATQPISAAALPLPAGAATEATLVTIDADTGNIATSLGNMDNSVDGNYLNVNMNLAGTDAQAAEGIITANTLRVSLATDDDAVTSLGLLDNSVDGNYLNVNMNIAGADISATVPMPVRPNEFELAAVTTHVKKYYTSAGLVTDGIIWSPAAGKRWYVTDIFIQVSAAATVTLEDDKAGGDDPIWKAELAANSGWAHSFNTPWYSGEDAADLIITTSAGNVYVTVTGYEI